MMHIAVTSVCLLDGLDDAYRCYVCMSVCLMVWMMHIAVTSVCLLDGLDDAYRCSVRLLDGFCMMHMAVTPVCLSA